MTTDTTDAVEAIARTAFARLDAHDLTHPETIWTDDAVDHFLPVGDAVGRDAIVAFFEEMYAAFPDFGIQVEGVVASDPNVVVQWRITGTFNGARFQGIRPTGRRVDFQGCDVVKLRDGLVIENTVYWDGAALARQIGMLPPQGSAGDRLLTRAFNAATFVRTLGRQRMPH